MQNGPVNALDFLGLWGDGKRFVGERSLCERKRLGEELGRYYSDTEQRRWLLDQMAALVKEIDDTPLGHSDLPGYEEFDWTAEDHDPNTSPTNGWKGFKGMPRHFRAHEEVESAVDGAINTCDKATFERVMHQGQDSFTHYDGGYRWWTLGHGPATVLGIDDPDDSKKYPERYESALRWTLTQLDKWNKKCCKNSSGQWEKCCSGE